MRPQLLPAIKMLAVLTLLTGLAYPLTVTAVSQLLFGQQADGSLIARDGGAIGSELQAQAFDGEEYFQPRPSAAGYDGSATTGSELGPTSPQLVAEVRARVADYRQGNGLEPDELVPVDAVTASGSGLDPHISVANARLQASRVSAARGVAVEEVLELVDRHTEGRTFGFLGEPRVNVLLINLDLDAMAAGR